LRTLAGEWDFFGVGVIMLGAQAARKYFGLSVEWFWLVIGFVFVLWGVWELVNIQRGPLPILFLVVGIAFGGMEVSEAKTLRALEEENSRLKRLVADQAVQIHILKEVNAKKV
jgi:hypothetical protein